MLISTKGRYALRVMAELAARRSEGYLSLSEIAARQGISEKYLEMILRVLVKNGLLAGQRGKGGGYRLTKAPEECSVGGILRLTEGTLAPVACLEGRMECARSAECSTLPMWRKLDGLISGYLDGVTLADLVCQEKTAGQ